MTGKEALDNLKEINRKQNNGNGDLWLESMVIEPIEKDLEKLEYIKALVKVYNNDEMHFTRHFDFINRVKEVLNNDK